MRRPVATVLGRLAAEGLAPPDAATRARSALAASALAASADAAVPWYVRVAAGVGAWVATLFLVLFLLSVVVEPDEPAAAVVGLLLVAGAIVLRRRATAEFARQLALAVSFAGQALVVVRIADAADSATVSALAVLALSAAMVALMPDAAHRFMSTVAGAVALFVAAAETRLAWGVGAPGPGFQALLSGGDVAVLALVAAVAWAWRGGTPPDRGRAALLEPVAYGLVVALLGILLLDAFLSQAIALGAREAARWQVGAASTVGATIALGALVLAVTRAHGGAAAREVRAVAIGGVLLLAALTPATPGIVVALALLALGFDRRNPVLVGLAAAFLVVFATLYYHGLRLTLLEKSGVLLASGVLLLAAAAYVARRFPASPRAAEDAP